MTRTVFGRRSGIVVDVCQEHGTWFDGGELDAILQFVRGGGLQVDPPTAAPPAIDRARSTRRSPSPSWRRPKREAQYAEDLAHFLRRYGHVWRTFFR